MSVESVRNTLKRTTMDSPGASAGKIGKASTEDVQPSAAPSSSSKPNLSVSIESPSWSPNSNGQHLWQQPYSELSRFPSASYRFRGSKEREYGLDSKYMIPLPSPSEYRSRSLSDAVSEASTEGGGEAGGSGVNAGKTPGRTKTLHFFESMDSAFSPPPPPRMPSANYDHSRRDLYSSTSSLPSSSTLPLDTSHLVSPPMQTSLSAQSYSSTVNAPASSVAPSTSNFQPLSNLPSAFRSEPSRQHPPISSTSHSHHARNRSGSHGPSVLGRQMVINESPLASPTESQSSRWVREPPARLPTLLPESALPTPVASTSSTAVSTPSSLQTSSLASEEVLIHTHSSNPAHDSEPGNVLDGQFEVIRNLGIGAFSKVVLAKRIRKRPPESGTNTPITSPKKLQLQELGLKKSASNTSIGRGHAPISVNFASLIIDKDGKDMTEVQSPVGIDGSEDQAGTARKLEEGLVALKLISRTHIKKNDRMRISIVREVEVLKHIRHPSLVHLTSSFDTPFHTCLVLEYSHGGELFDFLANHHEQTSEALARRIFGELADVLGWMHSIGLVHRDLKLENILLTTKPFPTSASSNPPASPPDPSSLPVVPTPIVKLTDFGLSRFIDPSSPYLETRCGSEEYAAPELIMGKRYDGRQTDAWALGVVLYALVTGYLPFVEDGSAGPQDGPSKNGTSPSAKGSAKSRRNYLLKIAKGEYHWPAEVQNEDGSKRYSDSARMVSEPVKALAAGLLSRDPKKRIRTEDVWDFAWMEGPGAPEKRSIRGGGLEGVSVSAFKREDEAMVRAEIPESG